MEWQKNYRNAQRSLIGELGVSLAQKDAKKLSAAGLRRKTEELLGVLSSVHDKKHRKLT